MTKLEASTLFVSLGFLIAVHLLDRQIRIIAAVMMIATGVGLLISAVVVGS